MTFRIISIGKINGIRLDEVFVSDCGLFYDPEDEVLIQVLTDNFPAIDWEHLVYWKLHDRGEIEILDPITDETVGKIQVRKRLGGDPSGEIDWTNVVRLITSRERG